VNFKFHKISKGFLITFLGLITFLSWQIYFKNSLILMPSEYKKIKNIVDKIAKENFLGINDIRFSITTGSHAVFLAKELGICKEDDCYFIRNLNPFQKHDRISGISLNEIINQSYLYNGLEAYAWSTGVIEISKSSFPFIGNNKSYLSCLISHELAHLLENHRHKKLIEVSKEFKIIGPNKISENQKKDIEYSIERKLELEADQIASKLVYLAGYDKNSCLFALKEWGVREAYELESNNESTHPGYYKRIDSLENFIKKNLSKDLKKISNKNKWAWEYNRRKNILIFKPDIID
jgi:hypothetical protein